MITEEIADLHRRKVERLLAIQDARRRESEVRLTAKERRDLLDVLRHRADGLSHYTKAQRLEARLRTSNQKIAAGLRGER